MSGTFPASPSPASIDIESSQPTLVTVADSGKRQARSTGGHLWELDLSFPLMTRAQFEPINAFVMNQKGSEGSFQYVAPDKATPLGVASGSPAVQVAASAGDTGFLANGVPSSVIDYIKAGDIFKFASHSKVYMCTVDADSFGSGSVGINFQPELIQNVSVGDAITLVNVPFTVYVEDILKYKVSQPQFRKYSVKLMEAL